MVLLKPLSYFCTISLNVNAVLTEGDAIVSGLKLVNHSFQIPIAS